ncbi:hypothetical protein GQ53DRAFT_611835, partial [Thozetella sp. PMI_491]
YSDLWKRRGGGGGGGRGGGSSGGGSSGGGRTSSGSSTGGKTSAGSGPAPAYGGGRYYGGGSAQPYAARGPSPSGLAPFALGAGVGLAFWPGLWYHPVYFYHTTPYSYHNRSNNMNETKPVLCGCDETEECGCDNNTDTTYMNDLIGNGSYSALNQSLVTVADVNGTSTILVNGSLPNGTTAAGGTDDDDTGDDSAAGGLRSLLETAGLWPMVATICVMVFV